MHRALMLSYLLMYSSARNFIYLGSIFPRHVSHVALYYAATYRERLGANRSRTELGSLLMNPLNFKTALSDTSEPGVFPNAVF